MFCLIYVKKKPLQNGIFEHLWIIAFTMDKLGKNISWILIFVDLELPRNSAKIRRRENFPFYGNSYDEVFSDDGISSVNDSVTSCDDSDKVSN